MQIIKEKYGYIATFVTGVVLTYFLYPTKKIEETVKLRYQKQIEQLSEKYASEISSISKTKDSTIQELSQSLSSYKRYAEDLSIKLTEMSSHKVEIKTKITRPDGTIEENSYFESQDTSSQKLVSEIKVGYEQQIQQLNEEWKRTLEKEKVDVEKVYEEKIALREKEIREEERKKVIESNTRQVGLEIGVSTDEYMYVHGTYDFWGPVFIGAESRQSIKSVNNISAGLGIGIRL